MLKIKDGRKYYIVLGAGGTGSWLAEFLSKIEVPVYLIDGDIVESKNVLRQNFVEEEVNMSKAEIEKNGISLMYQNFFLILLSLTKLLLKKKAHQYLWVVWIIMLLVKLLKMYFTILTTKMYCG